MAKSKSRDVEENKAFVNEEKTPFVPIHKKYKPVPKFNGKCKNC